MNRETSLVKREQTTSERFDGAPVATPPVDIYENDDEVLLVADLPGVKKDALEIHLDNDVLTLRGQRGIDHLEGDELRRVRYQRQFRVGADIDAGRISAQLSDGVLRLRLPKAEALKPRKIEVTAG